MNPVLDIRLLSRPFPTVWRKTEEFLFSLNRHLYTLFEKLPSKDVALGIYFADLYENVYRTDAQQSMRFHRFLKKEMYALNSVTLRGEMRSMFACP